MYKIPAKYKRAMETELKRMLPVIQNLSSRGKSSTEEDARMVINDILAYVLGYDKYNELRTEQREKNSRFDYAVRLNSNDVKRPKTESYDFIIEVKAAHVPLNQTYVNQTLTYCLTTNTKYFVLTNCICWKLYKVEKKRKEAPNAILIHEVTFDDSVFTESFIDDFYVFSKNSFCNNDWDKISDHSKVVDVSNVAATLLSDRVVKFVVKILSDDSDIRISTDVVRDIIENKIVRSEVTEVNTKLLRELNKVKKVSVNKRESIEQSSHVDVDDVNTDNIESDENINVTDTDKNVA